MLSLIEEIDEIGESSNAFMGIKVSIIETPGIIHGGRFLYFDECSFLLIIIRVRGDILLSTLIPPFDNTEVIIHFKLSN